MPRHPEQGSQGEHQINPRRRIKRERPEVPVEWQGFDDWSDGLTLEDTLKIHKEGKFPEGTPDLFSSLYSKTTVEDRLLMGIFGYPSIEEVLSRTPEEIQRIKEARGKGVAPDNHQFLKDEVNAVVATLSEREQKVLILRFGLEDRRSRTLKEAGEAINRSARTAGRVENAALKKLRKDSTQKKILRDYLE
jgi:hypothetical protein